MKIKIIIFYIVFLLSLSNIYSQKVNIKLEELWTIGNDEKATMDYIFKNPIHLLIDSKMNIYLHEEHAPDIKKYSPEGKYIGKTGRPGEGPGEFRVLYNIAINKKNEIIAFDIAMKRITYYDDKLKLIKTQNINSIIEPYYFSALNSSALLVSDIQEIRKSHILFSIYNNDMKEKKEQFGNMSELINFKDDYQAIFSFLWNIFVIDEANILATPAWYSQVSYNYKKDNGKWILNKLTGMKPTRQSYEIIDKAEYFKLAKKDGYVSGGPRDKKVFAKINHESIGIYSYKKYIIQLFLHNNFNGTSNFMANVFSMKGEYLGQSIIKSVQNNSAPALFLNVDKLGNVYIKENIDKVPVIKKYRVIISN